MIKKLKQYGYNLTHPVIGEIWQLHRVTSEHSVQERMRQYEITPARLESLIASYQRKGYEFISIADVAKRLSLDSRPSTFGTRLSASLPFLHSSSQKFVAVTLDDGYADNYEIAYPIFRKYNVPFCIYLCEKMVKGEIQESKIEHYRYLSIEHIEHLNNELLCTLGGHTTSHVHLSQLNEEQQREEIIHCKQWVETITQKPMEDFAYPYGDYNADTISIMKDLGIKRAVAAWGGALRQRKKYNYLTIPRLLVTESEKI